MNHEHEWEYLHDDLLICKHCRLVISSEETCQYFGHVWSKDTCLACGEKREIEPLQWWLIQDNNP